MKVYLSNFSNTKFVLPNSKSNSTIIRDNVEQANSKETSLNSDLFKVYFAGLSQHKESTVLKLNDFIIDSDPVRASDPLFYFDDASSFIDNKSYIYTMINLFNDIKNDPKLIYNCQKKEIRYKPENMSSWYGKQLDENELDKKIESDSKSWIRDKKDCFISILLLPESQELLKNLSKEILDSFKLLDELNIMEKEDYVIPLYLQLNQLPDEKVSEAKNKLKNWINLPYKNSNTSDKELYKCYIKQVMENRLTEKDQSDIYSALKDNDRDIDLELLDNASLNLYNYFNSLDQKTCKDNRTNLYHLLNVNRRTSFDASDIADIRLCALKNGISYIDKCLQTKGSPYISYDKALYFQEITDEEYSKLVCAKNDFINGNISSEELSKIEDSILF